MRTGVIAKKVGMTRLFQEDGRHVPVTVAGPTGEPVQSGYAVRAGTARLVQVDGLQVARDLRAVWRPPRDLAGPAADLVRIARSHHDDTPSHRTDPPGHH